VALLVFGDVVWRIELLFCNDTKHPALGGRGLEVFDTEIAKNKNEE
jgi:GTP cyclohydrolase II